MHEGAFVTCVCWERMRVRGDDVSEGPLPSLGQRRDPDGLEALVELCRHCPGVPACPAATEQRVKGAPSHPPLSLAVRGEAGRLTWVARMPCLTPVLCVPDPMTPAAVTSDTAPRLEGGGGTKGPVRLPVTMPPGVSV